MNLSTLPIDSPTELLSYFNSTHKASASRLSELGLPANKTEQYRFFGIKLLLNKEYPLSDTSSCEIEDAEYIHIQNGIVCKAPKELHVEYSATRLYDEKNYDALYHLSHLAAPEVIFISITQELQAPLKIKHHLTKGISLYRVVIQVAPNISVNIVEEFIMDEDAFAIYGYDIDVENYASLEFIRKQTLGSTHQLIGSHKVDVASNASLHLKSFDFGLGKGLHLYGIDLGENATLESAHLVDITSDSKQGNVLHVNHIGKASKSTQEAKYILNKSATGIFDGRIVVHESAKYTSARQNSKALILSHDEDVKMVAKPQLEIYTDELEASHGSSTGQLSEKELFYLRSRGISETEAKKMLMLAFANELIEKIEDATIQEEVKTAFENAHKG